MRGIGSHLLLTSVGAFRLKELQEGGVVRRVPLSNCGLVYELTPYGRSIEPIMLALGRWGFQAMGDPEPGDVITADSLTMALHTAFMADRAVDAEYELHVGDVALRASVREGELRVAQIAPPAPPVPPVGGSLPAAEPDAVIVAGPGIRHLIGGEVTPAEALAADIVAVVRGEESLLDSFAETFHIAAPGVGRAREAQEVGAFD